MRLENESFLHDCGSNVARLKVISGGLNWYSRVGILAVSKVCF